MKTDFNLQDSLLCPDTVVDRDGVWRNEGFSQENNEDYIDWVDGLSAQDLEAMVAAASTGEEAVRKLVTSNYPIFFRYLFDSGRTAWRYWSKIGPGSVVLDCGCGWGNLSLDLAGDVAHVCSLDSSISKLRFVSERSRHLCPGAISCIHHDMNTGLPFKDSTFSLVVLNGVLEWVGAFSDAGQPEDMQRRFLREVHRVLKPQGEVYIGIENRFGWEYFAGKAEDHVRLFGVSLMPRWLANMRCRKILGKDYRVRTYSLSALRRLLRSVGLDVSCALNLIPDYKHIQTAGIIKDQSCLRFQKGLGAASRYGLHTLVRRLPLLRRVAWRFAPDGRGRLLDRMDRVFLWILRESPIASRLVPSFGVVATKRHD